MLDRLILRLRGAFLIWIMPAGFFRGGSGKWTFPWFAVIYWFALWTTVSGSLSWFLSSNLFFPDMKVENLTETPALEAFRQQILTSSRMSFLLAAGFEVALLIVLLLKLRKQYDNPDSLGNTLCITEKERRKSVFQAGIIFYLILSAPIIAISYSVTQIILSPLYVQGVQANLPVPVFLACGFAACTAAYIVAFHLIFRRKSGETEEQSGRGE